jgi:hypothetical protein
MTATKRIRFSAKPNQKTRETAASRIEPKDRFAWVQFVTWFSAATPRPPLTLISNPKNGIKNKTLPNRKQATTPPDRQGNYKLRPHATHRNLNGQFSNWKPKQQQTGRSRPSRPCLKSLLPVAGAESKPLAAQKQHKKMTRNVSRHFRLSVCWHQINSTCVTKYLFE